MFPLLGMEPGHLISKSNTILSKLTGHLLVRQTLGSLYCHALFILAESKNQVAHEQKFKDLLSSTCLTSSERIVLDLESEVNQRPGLYSHQG